MPMRTRRSRSCTVWLLRRKGRVVSTRLVPKKPFLRTVSLTGDPSGGSGAGS